MSDEIEGTTDGKRGEAAWKQQRDEIAKRNVEAHRRGQAERKTREGQAEDRNRLEAAREAAQLHALNAQIKKNEGRSTR